MADEKQTTAGGLPPKLDLRSKMGAKAPQPALAVKPFQGKAATPRPAVSEDANAEVQNMRKDTMRIKLTDASVAPSAAGPDPTADGASAAPTPSPIKPPPASAAKPLTPKLKPRTLAKPKIKSVAPATVSPVTAAAPAPAAAAPAPAAPAPAAAAAPAASVPLAPKTVRIKATPLTPKSAAQFGAAVSDEKKKQTSKVPLETSNVSEDPLIHKTIKVQPLGVVGDGPQPQEGLPSKASAPNESNPKRQTSRIPLEQALSDKPQAGGSRTGPKTIRLKRPSQPSSIKVTQMTSPDESAAVSNKTTQLDEAQLGDVAAPTPTQKRTIKVRRPQGRPGGAVAVKRSSSPAAPAAVAADPTMGGSPAAPTDGAHWTFITFAIITTIVMLCSIYLFAAEAVGPNHGLTQLSSWVEGPDLSIPGNWKRPRQQQGY